MLLWKATADLFPAHTLLYFLPCALPALFNAERTEAQSKGQGTEYAAVDRTVNRTLWAVDTKKGQLIERSDEIGNTREENAYV
jgi:hypothetical protein